MNLKLILLPIVLLVLICRLTTQEPEVMPNESADYRDYDLTSDVDPLMDLMSEPVTEVDYGALRGEPPGFSKTPGPSLSPFDLIDVNEPLYTVHTTTTLQPDISIVTAIPPGVNAYFEDSSQPSEQLEPTHSPSEVPEVSGATAEASLEPSSPPLEHSYSSDENSLNSSFDSEAPEYSESVTEQPTNSIVDLEESSEHSYLVSEPSEKPLNPTIASEAPTTSSKAPEQPVVVTVDTEPSEKPMDSAIESEAPTTSSKAPEQPVVVTVDTEPSEKPMDSAIASEALTTSSKAPEQPVVVTVDTASPEKPLNPTIASEALATSSEALKQPVVVTVITEPSEKPLDPAIASEAPTYMSEAAEQLEKPMGPTIASKAPATSLEAYEQPVVMIVNTEPPINSKVSAAPEEPNFVSDTSTNYEDLSSPKGSPDLNSELLSVDDANNISEKPVEPSPTSNVERPNLEDAIEEVDNLNSILKEPTVPSSNDSEPPAAPIVDAKQSSPASSYSSPIATEKPIFFASMTSEPPLPSVVNNEESAWAAWNSESLRIQPNLSNTSTSPKEPNLDIAADYSTITPNRTTSSSQKYTTLSYSDSFTDNLTVTDLNNYSLPSDLSDSIASLSGDNLGLELDQNTTKSDYFSFNYTDDPKTSTFETTFYATEEETSTATIADVSYTTISTGTSSSSSSSTNSSIEARTLVEQLLNKISKDLIQNSQNIKHLAKDLNATSEIIAPLKATLIDSFDGIKGYLPPYAAAQGATLKDAVKHFMIMLSAIEKQYHTEIRHSFKMAHMFNALSKRLDVDEKRLEHLFTTRRLSY